MESVSEDAASSQQGLLRGQEALQQEAAMPHAMTQNADAFIRDWCAVFRQLHLQASSSGQISPDDRTQLLDCLDGRLWHFMACCLQTHRPIGLAAVAVQEAQALMDAVCQLANVAEAPLCTTAAGSPRASPPPQPTHLPSTLAAPVASSSVLQCSVGQNSLVEAFLGPQTAQASSAAAADLSPDAAQLTTFNDAYHWHTGRAIEPTYLGETAEARYAFTLLCLAKASLTAVCDFP